MEPAIPFTRARRVVCKSGPHQYVWSRVLCVLVLCALAPHALAGSATYVGPPDGSWFEPTHWSTGVLPDASTAVFIPDESSVRIEGGAGFAESVELIGDGGLTIAAGSLETGLLDIPATGFVMLDHADALLQMEAAFNDDDGIFVWNAGRVRVSVGTWRNFAHPLQFGAASVCTLEVEGAGRVSSLMIDVGPMGVIRGTGIINAGVVTNNGVIQPGFGIGTITFDTDLVQGPKGIIDIELSGYAGGSAHDLLDCLRDCTLGGSLRVDVLNTADPRIDRFTILEARTIEETFATVQQPDPPGPLAPGFAVLPDRVWIGLTTPAASRFYVNGANPPGGTGGSWAEAFDDLDDAFTAAALSGGAVQEIWVAAGTYLPTRQSRPGFPRSESFVPPRDVTIYGGFAGFESDLSERDIVANPTVLSGDLAGDDQPGFVNYSDNTNVVIWSERPDAAFTLDGFTIRGGNATGPFSTRGAAALINGNDVTFRLCTFKENSTALDGGAIGFNGDSLTLNTCVFENNRAVQEGGAIFTLGSVIASGCTFTGNSAIDGSSGGEGGAVFAQNAPLFFESCEFIANESRLGGAVSTHLREATFIGVAFRDNIASTADNLNGVGGAVYAHVEEEDLEFIECVFESNIAGRGGGGLFVESCWRLMMADTSFQNNQILNTNSSFGPAAVLDVRQDIRAHHCLFKDHSARFSGAVSMGSNDGAPFYEFVSCSFINNHAGVEGFGGAAQSVAEFMLYTGCLFVGNSAETGGAISDGSDTLFVTNCTFVHNSASAGSGGLWYNVNSATPGAIVISNNVFWANTLNGIDNEFAQLNFDSGKTPQVNYNCIRAFTGQLGGVGNISQNPMFIDIDGPDDIPGNADDDLRLLANSPCIDAADNFAVPNNLIADLDGMSRFIDDPGTADTGNGTAPIIDMGAYEFQATSATPAVITDFEVVFGALVSGGLQEIVSSNDEFLRARSVFGFSANDPNLLDVVIGAESQLSRPTSMDLMFESRLNNPGGSAALRLFDWGTDAFTTVHSFPLGIFETTEIVKGLEASRFIRRSDGRIETSWRVSVVATFSAEGFDGFIDHVAMLVEE